jgi:hypothetical protein
MTFQIEVKKNTTTIKIILVSILLLFTQNLFSQTIQRVLPIGTYFRDVSLMDSTIHFPVFPQSNSFYNSKVKEDKKRYSTFGYFLFQRELIELKAEEGKLWITPLLDISYGKSTEDSLNTISQNTRGVRMEGILGKKLFFTTSFYENQIQLPSYARSQALKRGEIFPNYSNGTFSQQHAMISGSARTKPFKENGFDYGYALGSIHWQVHKKLNLSWGNNQHFIGSGYRSLIWSDNAIGAINFKADYSPFSRWTFSTMKSRALNLIRRSEKTSAEALYENKLMGFNSVYFKASEKLTVGIVESSVWMREDSIERKPVSPLYFLPLVGSSLIEEATESRSSTMLAFDLQYKAKNYVIYSQIGANPLKAKSSIVQFGGLFYPNSKKLNFIQLEYNFTDVNAYSSSNSRLHFTNSNLFQAHPMGNQVSELLLRFNYEFKNLFVAGTINYYFKQNSNYGANLPVFSDNSIVNQSVLNSLIEVGYRINRSYGFEVFTGLRVRTLTDKKSDLVTWINAGVRTNINNHYFDF